MTTVTTSPVKNKKRYSFIHLRARQIIKNPLLLANLGALPFLWCSIIFCPVWLQGCISIYATLLSGMCLYWILFGLPDVYRHFKTGDLYEELFSSEVIIFEEDGTQMVVYRPLFQKGYRNIWARRYNIFHELVLPPDKVTTGKKVCRFSRLL